MNEYSYTYDEISDTLSISFLASTHATKIELTDHILLRINKLERRAVGITLLDYSLLAKATDMGQKSFSLIGLDSLSEETKQIVIELLKQPPVNEILTISTYISATDEHIPIVMLHPCFTNNIIMQP